MATTVGELKIHVTACGIPELEHLLAMLQANIAVLPGVVVKAMQALADSASSESAIEISPVKIGWDNGVPAGDITRTLSMVNQRVTQIGSR